MFLNVFISNTHGDALAVIDRPGNLKVLLYSGVHIRVPLLVLLILVLCRLVWVRVGEEARTELFGCNSEG